jgi:hypothetical protein
MIKMDFREMEWSDVIWNDLAQAKDWWRALVDILVS